MEGIIEKIYELHVRTQDFPFGASHKEELDEEWKLYDVLYNDLPAEYKELFRKYVNLRGVRQERELKSSYEYGFKTAVKLLTEALKE